MRLYAYLAIALAVMGLFAYGVHVWRKAERVEVAEKALVIERQQHKADNEKAAKDIKESEEQRQRLASGLQAVTDRFNSIVIPLPKTLVKTVEVPGACPRVGVSDDFVRVYNEASASAR